MAQVHLTLEDEILKDLMLGNRESITSSSKRTSSCSLVFVSEAISSAALVALGFNVENSANTITIIHNPIFLFILFLLS